jgi:hypothetical protein
VNDSLSGMVSREKDILRRLLIDVLNAELQLGIRKLANNGEAYQGMSDEQLKKFLEEILESNKKGCGIGVNEEYSQDLKTG